MISIRRNGRLMFKIKMLLLDVFDNFHKEKGRYECNNKLQNIEASYCSYFVLCINLGS